MAAAKDRRKRHRRHEICLWCLVTSVLFSVFVLGPLPWTWLSSRPAGTTDRESKLLAGEEHWGDHAESGEKIASGQRQQQQEAQGATQVATFVEIGLHGQRERKEGGEVAGEEEDQGRRGFEGVRSHGRISFTDESRQGGGAAEVRQSQEGSGGQGRRVHAQGGEGAGDEDGLQGEDWNRQHPRTVLAEDELQGVEEGDGNTQARRKEQGREHAQREAEGKEKKEGEYGPPGDLLMESEDEGEEKEEEEEGGTTGQKRQQGEPHEVAGESQRIQLSQQDRTQERDRAAAKSEPEKVVPTVRAPHRTPGSCWSKAESHLYYATSFAPSMALSERLRKYEALHKRCTQRVGNWTDHFLGNGPSELADCQYLVHSCPAGLGNHLVSLVSVFLYAMLTNRVLVLHWSHMRNSLCSPFPESSWRLPWYMDSPIFGLQKVAPRLSDLMALHNAQPMRGHKKASVPWNRPLLQNGRPVQTGFLWLSWDWKEEDEQFFCPVAQLAISRVPWIVYHSEQYAVPGYFQMPQFQKELKALFPDKIVFTHLARFLLHPNNHLWERITRLYRAYGGRANRRVGLQVRTFADNDEYAHERILECAVNVSRELPPPIPAERWASLMEGNDNGQVSTSQQRSEVQSIIANPQPKDVTVYLTSLHAHHSDYFRQLYSDTVAEDGSIISVFSGSHDGTEVHDIERDRRALTEMWLLSFSDSLLTSEMSTFGYVAAGLAGIRPYLMNNANASSLPKFWENGRSVCTRLRTCEPCFQFPPYQAKCLLKSPTYIQRCLDFRYGKQIVQPSHTRL